MIDYKIIKHCRLCRKRFVVHKVDAKKNFCNECQPSANRRLTSGTTSKRKN